MADNITQTNRLLGLTTPAGEDVLMLDSVTGSEAISVPYRFELKMVSEIAARHTPQIQPHNLVGQPMTVRLTLTQKITGVSSGERYWNGLCERFVQEHQDENFAYFSAVIVPWFSFLGYSSNCRIFQGKSVPDIIQAVVAEHGFNGQLKLNLSKTYTVRDYCVQYRETDFAFLSRLMESEGIYYFFDHTDSSHTMVLADAPSQYPDLPDDSPFKYSPLTGLEATEDTIRTWRVEEQIHTGKWTYRDYHQDAPDSRFEFSSPSPGIVPVASGLETYQYPGGYAKKFNKADSASDVRPEGDKLTRLRMEKEEAFRVAVSGMSKCKAFASGYKIHVVGGFAEGTYLLTGLTHEITQQPAYRTTSSSRDPYRNNFIAIPATRPFVPAMVHNTPAIHGLQTAVVIDESDSGNVEEIWPDKYGRVRVRFFWDREAKYGCWLRVVQTWAGKGWGQLWIPRIGDEVAVSFLEGDPDCPVVVGSIYNSSNMPIVQLPANKTQSGILTKSTPRGGSSNYNMLRFEDKFGQEEIFIQAEKDWNSVIKNDETRNVKNNRTTTIHVNESRTVETGDDTIKVAQGKRTITVAGNISETCQQGNISTTANQGNISTEAQAGNISTKALANISVNSQVGNITIQASVGQISITGVEGVTISCGASSIEMTPASISISAPIVLINS